MEESGDGVDAADGIHGVAQQVRERLVDDFGEFVRVVHVRRHRVVEFIVEFIFVVVRSNGDVMGR